MQAEEYKGYKFPLAVSIVLSGQYEDDNDDGEKIEYTGQGGNDLLGNKHQYKNQELERGNLVLKVSASYKKYIHFPFRSTYCLLSLFIFFLNTLYSSMHAELYGSIYAC